MGNPYDEKPKWRKDEDVHTGMAMLMYFIILPSTWFLGTHFHWSMKPLFLWVILLMFFPGFLGLWLGKKLTDSNTKNGRDY
jgi:hypothetical protein